ncbi:MAG TPA: HAD-IC family P-type ATPase, partial [Firmicutes bacterium]|nr:HAD-IC family P-type ATPase [Bacillota bacterium]
MVIGAGPLLSRQEIFNKYNVDPGKGLSRAEAARLYKSIGPNDLIQKKKTSMAAIFLAQFKDFMVLVLLGATLLSGLMGEYSDAITIIIIVVLNAVLGFLQEFRAERSLAALKKLAAPTARVIRDGNPVTLPAVEIVPGDIVFLEAGDRVPADMRLLWTEGLSVDESSLTGESVPVEKNEADLKHFKTNLGDLTNMAFMGTLVVAGRGRGIVTATGMQTEMGKVAGMLQEADSGETPLQRRLNQLGKLIVAGCLMICVLVFFLGVYRGISPYKMLMAGVSLAVAAIPEGLPAIVTISLAIGVQRMIARKAIVRKLPAVETLGCATVICADKTGTLTENKMSVQQVVTGEGCFHLVAGQTPLAGDFILAGRKKKVRTSDYPSLYNTLRGAALCNNALLERKGMPVRPLWRGSEEKIFHIKGNPTEKALLLAAIRGGAWQDRDAAGMQRLKEFPFDSIKKRMTVICRDAAGKKHVYVKGAPDEIIKRCAYIFNGKTVIPLTAKGREPVNSSVEFMAAQGLRTIAVAWKELPESCPLTKEPDSGLVYLGVFGLQDPPRREIAREIARSRSAGIKTVMITGDHKATAMAIAKKIGLAPPQGKVLTGREIEAMDEKELAAQIKDTYVFARVAPAHKLKIVRAFKHNGHVVAMTGDGVNDAPAIKEADIGIAMGIAGTDVTKEAADLIIGDDNYGTIVAAVEEGRNIYNNIRKFILFLLTCNVGEIFTMLLAMALGLPLPLKPIQILWVNLVTDGLPAMA